MAKLLYIEASPRKQRSHSIAVAQAFLQAYRPAHPEDTVEHLNLWQVQLPDLDDEALGAKYAILEGQAHTTLQAEAWHRIATVFHRFEAADKYLFAVPMWNFHIPYQLKHFIDVITQPGLAFEFIPGKGYKGLVTGKPAAVIYSRGGQYGPGSGAEAFDLQKAYMELWLGFIGFTDLRSIVVEPTIAAPDEVAKVKAAALGQAADLAAVF